MSIEAHGPGRSRHRPVTSACESSLLVSDCLHDGLYVWVALHKVHQGVRELRRCDVILFVVFGSFNRRGGEGVTLTPKNDRRAERCAGLATRQLLQVASFVVGEHDVTVSYQLRGIVVAFARQRWGFRSEYRTKQTQPPQYFGAHVDRSSLYFADCVNYFNSRGAR